jgi:hypothetical protein
MFTVRRKMVVDVCYDLDFTFKFLAKLQQCFLHGMTTKTSHSNSSKNPTSISPKTFGSPVLLAVDFYETTASTLRFSSFD